MARSPWLAGQEKRRWRRYESDVPIRIFVEEQNRTLAIEGRCLKMSAGGMCFFAVGDFTPGTRILFEFANGGCDDSAMIRATVRNRAVYLYGAEYELAGVAPR